MQPCRSQLRNASDEGVMREPGHALRTGIALLPGEMQASNAFGIDWLAARDGIRNWLLTAA